MTAAGPEPASVTASRQLAAESRDRPRRVPPEAGGSARRTRGTEASRRTIRPLGRARPGEEASCPSEGDDGGPPGA